MTFVLSRRGLPYSTPLTITLMTLIIETLGLWIALLVTTGIPAVAPAALLLFVVGGILQSVVRQLTYVGIDKIGAVLSGPLPWCSRPLTSTFHEHEHDSPTRTTITSTFFSYRYLFSL